VCCREFLSKLQEDGDFTIVRELGRAPPKEQTCTVSVPVHLRHEYPFGTQSIGHLIRDNFQALVEIPMNFQLNASRFAWVTWPRDKGNNPFKLTHAMSKYSGLVSNHPSYKWVQLMQDCQSGLLGGGALPPGHVGLTLYQTHMAWVALYMILAAGRCLE
jgi:hypothetical protein